MIGARLGRLGRAHRLHPERERLLRLGRAPGDRSRQDGGVTDVEHQARHERRCDPGHRPRRAEVSVKFSWHMWLENERGVLLTRSLL